MTINSTRNTTATQKICSNDLSHKSSKWCKNPDDTSRDLCKNCYNTALTNKKTAEGRVCSNNATHKTNQWSKDPNDKTRNLCIKCYNTALANKKTAEGRVCSNDAKHKTNQWRKDPNDKTRNLCTNCYNTALANKKTAEGRVCSSNDPTHKTQRWHKDPNDKTRYLCNACYLPLRRKRRMEAVQPREQDEAKTEKDSKPFEEPNSKRVKINDRASLTSNNSPSNSSMSTPQPFSPVIANKTTHNPDFYDFLDPSVFLYNSPILPPEFNAQPFESDVNSIYACNLSLPDNHTFQQTSSIPTPSVNHDSL